MANDLATLNPKLAAQLRDLDAAGDPSYAVWSTEEVDDLLIWAAAETWPKIAATIREEVALADDDDQYTLEDVAEISRVDLLDEDDKLIGPLPNGTWEFWGDQETIGGTLFINTRYATTGRTLRVHGYAPLNLSTQLPADRIVPLIMALARAEAWRRMVGQRARFAEWMALNQKENVTVNELTIMVNQAEAEADRLSRQIKTWRRPKPAR